MVMFGVGLGKMVAFETKHGHVEVFISVRLVFRMVSLSMIVL